MEYKWFDNMLPKTREEGYQLALREGLLPKPPFCRSKTKGHSEPVTRFSHYSDSDTYLDRYRCPKRNKCRPDIFVSSGTWFENSRLSIQSEFIILYHYAHGSSYEQIQRACTQDVEKLLATDTISNRVRYCREMVTEAFSKMQEQMRKTGGQGVVVQIDESMFGHRKYNMGRILNGHWVLGIIKEGSQDLRCVLCPDNKRGAEVLLPIIQKHVVEGSDVWTDCWKAYDGLKNLGYSHHTVNHSKEFLAEDGTHTQRIESQWNVLKRKLKGRSIPESQFADVLCEELWRRYCRKINIDPMEVY
ncbi:uncharacterized protein [Euwallacea similis]|uniref:uncharacterized protein n=1 Tax=Euwallacea similis TaxID=1736056 RepID=UPI00344D7C2B